MLPEFILKLLFDGDPSIPITNSSAGPISEFLTNLIDASEAAKHPEMRESLYGGNPADRIHFSSGRDLVLSEASRKQPLNYFIYPYAEVAGEPWSGKIKTRFSYRDLPEL